MQRLEVSGAVRPIYVSLGVKRLICQLKLRCRLEQAYSMFHVVQATSAKFGLHAAKTKVNTQDKK